MLCVAWKKWPEGDETLRKRETAVDKGRCACRGFGGSNVNYMYTYIIYIYIYIHCTSKKLDPRHWHSSVLYGFVVLFNVQWQIGRKPWLAGPGGAPAAPVAPVKAKGSCCTIS